MFLLVPAHPGCLNKIQRAVKQLTVRISEIKEGHKTEPCGTLQVVGNAWEFIPLTNVNCFPFDK